MKLNPSIAAMPSVSLQSAVWRGMMPIYLRHWHQVWEPFNQVPDLTGKPAVGLVQVKRVPEQIWYAWAIAHSLSPRLHLAPTDIAVQLTQRFNQSIAQSSPATNPDAALPDWDSFEEGDRSSTLAQFVWASCRVHAHSSGMVQLSVGDRGVAAWLHSMSQGWLYLPLGQHEDHLAAEACEAAGISAQVTRVWPIQVAHARCCSLLRLAADAGIIPLQTPEPHENGWRIPHTLPWLTDAGALQCRDRVEYELVQTLVAVLDDAWDGKITPKTALRQAKQVSDRLSQLDAAYPLFGEVRWHPVARVQVRLGLVCIAKEVLGWLLHTWLRAEAPTEL